MIRTDSGKKCGWRRFGALLAGALLLLGACSQEARRVVEQDVLLMPPPGPPDDLDTVEVPAAQSRLVLGVETLRGGTYRAHLYSPPGGAVMEEIGAWEGPEQYPASAGMVLSESTAGPPPTNPQDPKEVLEVFPRFRYQKTGTGTLFGSLNVLGDVYWRRANIGTSTCVVFLQRWGDGGTGTPSSSLSGYYCAEPGTALGPGSAETVVQSIGLRPARTDGFGPRSDQTVRN